jgi:RNA polymerase sigma-70 factor (ECF subfamily)
LNQRIDIWVLQAQTGDRIAFNRLVSEYYQRVYRLAWKYFLQQTDGEDPHDLANEVTQKTFIQVHEKLTELKETKRFQSWLFRIATNYCYEEDRRRKRKRWIHFSRFQREENAPSPSSWHDHEPGADQQMMRAEQSQQLQQALGELKPEQRLVILLKEYESLTFREIAEVLDISENTAKSRLYYGLKNLRRSLESSELSQTRTYES